MIYTNKMPFYTGWCGGVGGQYNSISTDPLNRNGKKYNHILVNTL